VSSDILAFDDLRFTARRETEFISTRRGCHTCETFCLLGVVNIVRVRDRRPQPHEPRLLFNYWNGANQKDIDNAEDRCVETDTESQRHHGHESESGCLPKHSQSETHVLQYCLHWLPTGFHSRKTTSLECSDLSPLWP